MQSPELQLSQIIKNTAVTHKNEKEDITVSRGNKKIHSASDELLHILVITDALTDALTRENTPICTNRNSFNGWCDRHWNAYAYRLKLETSIESIISSSLCVMRTPALQIELSFKSFSGCWTDTVKLITKSRLLRRETTLSQYFLKPGSWLGFIVALCWHGASWDRKSIFIYPPEALHDRWTNVFTNVSANVCVSLGIYLEDKQQNSRLGASTLLTHDKSGEAVTQNGSKSILDVVTYFNTALHDLRKIVRSGLVGNMHRSVVLEQCMYFRAVNKVLGEKFRRKSCKRLVKGLTIAAFNDKTRLCEQMNINGISAFADANSDTISRLRVRTFGLRSNKSKITKV